MPELQDGSDHTGPHRLSRQGPRSETGDFRGRKGHSLRRSRRRGRTLAWGRGASCALVPERLLQCPPARGLRLGCLGPPTPLPSALTCRHSPGHLLASATLRVAAGQVCSCPGTCTGRALPGCLLPSSPGQPRCCLPWKPPRCCLGASTASATGPVCQSLGGCPFLPSAYCRTVPPPHSCRSRWAQAAVAQAPLSAPSRPGSGPGWRGAGSAQPCCRPPH